MPRKKSNASKKKAAIAALESARSVHVASWAKLGDIVALKKRLGQKYTSELRKKTATSRRIAALNSRILDAREAKTIIRAPTLTEIRQVARLVKAVQAIAVKKATLKAAFSAVKKALTKSSSNAAKVRLG
jgi:hypothetical protein